MAPSRKATVLVISCLTILALTLGLGIQVLAQGNQANWASSSESGREGTSLSPPDGLNINPALPENRKPMRSAGLTGLTSSEIPAGRASAVGSNSPDQININPNLTEAKPGRSVEPISKVENSSE